jgi:hypothetical protein
MSCVSGHSLPPVLQQVNGSQNQVHVAIRIKPVASRHLNDSHRALKAQNLRLSICQTTSKSELDI